MEISTPHAWSQTAYRGAGEETSCRPEDAHHCQGSWSPPRNFQWFNAAGSSTLAESGTFFKAETAVVSRDHVLNISSKLRPPVDFPIVVPRGRTTIIYMSAAREVDDSVSARGSSQVHLKLPSPSNRSFSGDGSKIRSSSRGFYMSNSFQQYTRRYGH